MDITAMLDRFEELRDLGTPFDPAGSHGNSDFLNGLLGSLEHRGHLDRLIGDLPNGEAVAERTEQFLLQKEPASRSDDELLGFAAAHIGELVAAAARDAEPGSPVAAQFASLADCPVTLSDDEPGATGAEIVGGAFAAKPTGDSAGNLLTTDEVASIVDQDAEWAYSRVRIPERWEGPAVAYHDAVASRPGVGSWLLEPVVTTEFDFEPFYRLWEAGASLWLTTDGFTVVRSGHLRWRTTNYAISAAPVVTSTSDADWLQINAKHGNRILEIIETARGHGGSRVEFDGLEMTTLPPSLLDSNDWNFITIRNAPGIAGWESAFDLPQITGIVVDRSDLTSTPSRWATTLEGVSLDRNRLSNWPENLDQAHQLEVLSLSHNELAEVPDSISALTNLKVLKIDHNNIHTVSPAIEFLQQLTQLTLGWNPELDTLPREVLDLPAECRVDLKKTKLPKALTDARSIEQLRPTWPGPGWT